LSVQPNNFLVSELHHLKLISRITGQSVQILVVVANRDGIYKINLAYRKEKSRERRQR
jgi:hypothetical protein